MYHCTNQTELDSNVTDSTRKMQGISLEEGTIMAVIIGIVVIVCVVLVCAYFCFKRHKKAGEKKQLPTLPSTQVMSSKASAKKPAKINQSPQATASTVTQSNIASQPPSMLDPRFGKMSDEKLVLNEDISLPTKSDLTVEENINMSAKVQQEVASGKSRIGQPGKAKRKMKVVSKMKIQQ